MESTDIINRVLVYDDRLRQYALSLTRNQEDAEDLVQDTYLKVMQNPESFAVPTNLKIILKEARIERVLCNGQTAGRLYQRLQQPMIGIPAIILPSTSPLNAAWSLDRLVDVWGTALEQGER